MAVCAGAVALGVQAASLAEASGYLAVSAASAIGMAIRFKSEVFR